MQFYYLIAGDSFAARHNGKEFSTFDRDNDNDDGNCARERQGAWWYDDCGFSNLNGLYFDAGWAQGICWNTYLGPSNSFPFVEMKMRPLQL